MSLAGESPPASAKLLFVPPRCVALRGPRAVARVASCHDGDDGAVPGDTARRPRAPSRKRLGTGAGLACSGVEIPTTIGVSACPPCTGLLASRRSALTDRLTVASAALVRRMQTARAPVAHRVGATCNRRMGPPPQNVDLGAHAAGGPHISAAAKPHLAWVGPADEEPFMARHARRCWRGGTSCKEARLRSR
jgi:hypothetical protein